MEHRLPSPGGSSGTQLVNLLEPDGNLSVSSAQMKLDLLEQAASIEPAVRRVREFSPKRVDGLLAPAVAAVGCKVGIDRLLRLEDDTRLV